MQSVHDNCQGITFHSFPHPLGDRLLGTAMRKFIVKHPKHRPLSLIHTLRLHSREQASLI
jgi:hypothetical protein